MDVEADLLRALRRIAGVSDGSDFTLKEGDVSFRVEYVGGSSSRLTLRARYDTVAHADVAPGARESSYRVSARGGSVRAVRPMTIELTRESSADRQAKEEGLSREHQTGDAAFDNAVYIDTPTVDEVLRSVLSEQVRGGVMELLSLGFSNVIIDDSYGDVTALVSSFVHLADADEAAPRIVRAFAGVLRGLPPVRSALGTHPKKSALPTVMLVTGGIAMFVLGPIGFFGIAGAHDCTESSSDGDGVTLKDGCGAPALLGLLAALVFGIVAAKIARSIARPRVAGQSDSHKRLSRVGYATFCWTALVVFVASAAIGYAGR